MICDFKLVTPNRNFGSHPDRSRWQPDSPSLMNDVENMNHHHGGACQIVVAKIILLKAEHLSTSKQIVTVTHSVQ